MSKNLGGRPPLFNTPEELEKCLDAYRLYLEETGKPPTIAGMAYYTGLDRKSIYNYEKKDKFFYAIKKFRDWILMTYEETAADKGNAGIIFLMKNYGYTDKQEIEQTNLGDMVIKVIDA